LSGEGVPDLIRTLDGIGARVAAEGTLSRRRRRARYLIARAASDIVARRIKAGGKDSLEPLADAVLSGTMTPDEAAKRMLDS
jgi:LAO/AO transport system kinase